MELRRLLALVALAGLPTVPDQCRGPGAGRAPPDALEVPPGMFTLDAARVADERTGNAVVAATREALAQTGVLFAPMEIRELALRDAALAALQRNLDIKRSGLNKSVVQRALIEAEAVFDPVFTLSDQRDDVAQLHPCRASHAVEAGDPGICQGPADQDQRVDRQHLPVRGHDRHPGSARGHAGEDS